MTISLLDERRCRGARWKAAATAAHERNGREASKGRGSRDTRGMKGWRPSAIPKGPKPVRAFCGRILCRTSDRSACLFPRGPGPGPRPRVMTRLMTRGSWLGDPWTVGFPFRAHRLRGRRVGQIRPSVRDLKNGASPSPRSKRQGRTRNEDQGNDAEIRANGQHRRRPWPPSTGEATQEIKKCS